MSVLLGMLGIAPAEQGTPDRWARGGELLAAAAPLAAVKRGIRAFHGSPHDFDKFSLGKVGSGEGAQAYGHGLYFAEKEGTAKVYRDALGGDALQLPTGDKMVPTPGSVEDRALAFLATFSGGGSGIDNPHRFARGEVQKLIDRGTGSNRPGEMDTLAAIKNKLWEWEQAGVKAGSGGRMYEVNINADPDTLLDWDNPLSQQPEGIRYVMQDAGNPTGKEIYNQFMNDGRDVAIRQGRNADTTLPAAQSEASRQLREMGIPGIKYLDQGSRQAGEGSRNYVIFDDSLIDILRKYGLLPAAVGAGAMMGGRSAPADQ